MAIDKELFYASHGLKYPVVARPYTDDIVVKEKFFTKADMVAMLEEIKNGIDYQFHDDGGYYADKDEVDAYIQQKINALKADNSRVNNSQVQEGET